MTDEEIKMKEAVDAWFSDLIDEYYDRFAMLSCAGLIVVLLIIAKIVSEHHAL